MSADHRERRYQEIFDAVPISLWEEDYTAIMTELAALKARGVVDFARYFAEHPEVVKRMASEIEVLEVNAATLGMYGVTSKQELLGSLDKIFLPETFMVFLDQLIALASGERVFTAESLQGTAYGRRLWVHLTLTVLPPRDGRWRAVVSIVDISRRKRAEQQLSAQERLYRTLIESMPHMVWTGDRDGQITYCNQAMLRSVGMSLDQVRGRDWTEMIHPDDRAMVLALRANAYMKGDPYRGECRLTTADGRHRTVSFIDTPVTGRDGEIASWVGIHIDVTRLKDVQDELQRALRRSHEELAAIAYAASHDLQEPLRMVTSYAQMLHQRYGEQLDDKADKYIKYVVDGAKRIRQLILDLLALSNVRMDGRELKPTDCNRVVARVIEAMTDELAETDATIAYDELPEVMADSAQMTLVFYNLFSNSIKFRGHDAPRVQVSAHRDGAMWTVCVTDNGVGLDADRYGERVFELFQRLHHRDRYEGTGIGLTIVRKIIERHGGRVWVESEPGQGAAFMFTLPVMD